MSGTVGKRLRMEAFGVKVSGVSGGVQYRSHVQSIGWQSWVSDGAVSGTTGRGLRDEALGIRLSGDMASKFDVYYRVQVSSIGWLGWAKNGANAGTSGYALPIEAYQVQLVAKGGAAPGSTADTYRAK